MIKAILTATLISIAAFLAMGCNSTTSVTSASSPACTYTSSGLSSCILYVATIGQSNVDSSCATVSGTTSASCSATNRVGVCAVNSATTTSITYYSSGYNDTTAAAACTGSSGTYTSG
jgi:hypothetical protein